ncbi:mCG1029221, partial [Mus musculus]
WSTLEADLCLPHRETHTHMDIYTHVYTKINLMQSTKNSLQSNVCFNTNHQFLATLALLQEFLYQYRDLIFK